jgi:quinolinate synthase
MNDYQKTVKETYYEMKKKLAQLVPDIELRAKAELVREIRRLKHESSTIILGHNYMEAALFQTVPDFVGDSLYLSYQAAKTEVRNIIFCGVKFMAETAKILSPEKNIYIPSLKAGCSLASSITAQDVINLRKNYPNAKVVTYINTYADVKAESDICVTSGNAAKVLKSIQDKIIIFLPDEFMARNLASEVGRDLFLAEENISPDEILKPSIIAWKGHCEVHEQFTVSDVKNVRAQFPDVKVITHPESPPEVVAASDYTGGTSQMVEYVKKNKAPHFLILTECSMGDNIIAENPDKNILRLCSVRCPHMNQITLEDTLKSLREKIHEITLPKSLVERAKKSVEAMLQYR